MSVQATHVRIQDKTIVESYLTPEMIATRGHPIGWYVPIVYEVEPKLNPYEQAVPTSRIMGNVTPDENGFFKDCYVMVTYHVETKPLQTLINEAWNNQLNQHFLRPGEEPNLTPPVISELDPLLIAAIVKQAKAAIQKKLDDFAATRDYDGIMSACSYATDTDPTQRAEGEYCVKIRTESWNIGNTLFNNIISGQQSMIKSFKDVEALLPVYEWPANI